MTKTGTKSGEEFIGYDLGHGETALSRAYAGSLREPEILEFRGEKSFVTAVARSGAHVRIGAEAVNLPSKSTGRGKSEKSVWVKFKSRDFSDPHMKDPTQAFTKKLFETLETEKQIYGRAKSRVIVGCPSGWSKVDRGEYAKIFESAGLKNVRVVPESRAALMTALEQGYLTIDDARDTVLIIDIGSSTTDFTFCRDLEAEDVGHNILGSGLLDTEIFKLNLARQPAKKKIEALIKRHPNYEPILEYWCRLAKEQFYNGDGSPVEIIRRLPIDKGVFFEIRIDAQDSATILGKTLDALNGYSWTGAFDYALKETLDMLGDRQPTTVLLTGGASRLPLVVPACEMIFPNSRIVRGAEPEFAIARGLSWLGRFEYLHTRFKSAVSDLLSPDGSVHVKAKTASNGLGEKLAPALVDALAEACIVPAFQEWRAGRISNIHDIEGELEVRVKSWLSSPSAQKSLRPVIDDWFARLQRNIEVETDPLCREHGLPAMVLSLDDSQHMSQYLDDISLEAPKVASLESDTALAGTTISAVIIGVLLAKANLLAPLLANPIGLIIGGAMAGGGFLWGRKALEGQFKQANVPVIARKLMTDGRIRRAIKKQRPDMIRHIHAAWSDAAADRFTGELVDTLGRALGQRANDRAVLFLI